VDELSLVDELSVDDESSNYDDRCRLSSADIELDPRHGTFLAVMKSSIDSHLSDNASLSYPVKNSSSCPPTQNSSKIA